MQEVGIFVESVCVAADALGELVLAFEVSGHALAAIVRLARLEPTQYLLVVVDDSAQILDSYLPIERVVLVKS